jgi:ectoine hydroxylase-related dioxygenase (phytanoyl-CoA dioxygenase family)
MLSPVAPKGGGTAVVAGSHRLAERIAARSGTATRSADVTRRLRAEHPWFAALSSKDAAGDRIRRFMREGAEIDGIHVRVAEMTGEPGDAWFMHPSLLHTAAPNTGEAPRMMLTQWIDGARQAASALAGMGPT